MADTEREVRTTYSIVDRASSGIAALSKQASELHQQLQKTSTGIAGLSARISQSFSGMGKVFERPRDEFGRFTKYATGFPGIIQRMRDSVKDGFSAMSTGVSTLASGIMSLPSLLFAVGAALTSSGIAKLGDQFEQTQLQIAGFLSALGVTSNFNDGLVEADIVMEKIRVAAARLPGEAEDYIQVFRAGLPVLQSAVGGTLNDMTAFSNRYAAITKTLGIDAAQAARDINMMLRQGKGGAGMDVRSFTALLPFLRQVKGQADLTTESFNAMTAPERAKILAGAFATLQPMLDKAADSFDSMMGAAVSNIRHIARLGTMPLFEGMKQGLASFNSMLSDADGNLTPLGNRLVNIGRMISDGLVTGVSKAVDMARELYGWFERIWQSPAAQSILAKLGAAAGSIGSAAGGMLSGSGAMATAATGLAAIGSSNPLSMLMGPTALVVGILGELASRGQVVTGVLDFLASIFASLATLIGPALGMFEALTTLGADLAQGILAGLLPGIVAIVEPLAAFGVQLFNLVGSIATRMRPAFIVLGQAVGNLFRSIGDFLAPVIRIVGAVFLKTVDIITRFLMPAFNFLIDIIGGAIDALAKFISWLGSLLGKVADKLDGGAPKPSTAPTQNGESWFADLMSRLEATMKFGASAESRAMAPKARGGGGRATMDFRYSRFDITQKFEEGISPDQVAVMFAKDIGRLGEQRLESGFSPLFGVS